MHSYRIPAPRRPVALGLKRTVIRNLTASAQATKSGIFADEIIPVDLRGSVVSVDDTIRPGTTLEGLSKLKSSFPDWGEASTTAGNASGLGDGAALCILTTRERAEKEGWDILAKYVTSTFVGEFPAFVHCDLPLRNIGVEPRYMGIAPVAAVSKVLSQVGLAKEDVDIYEVRWMSTARLHAVAEHRLLDKRSLCLAVCVLCGAIADPNREDQPEVSFISLFA